MDSSLSPLDLVILLACGAVALDVLARQLTTPRPVVLAGGGLLVGVLWQALPRPPALALPPQLALQLVLPPLLAVAAFRVPLGAFRASLRPITLLAVGLVLVTMAAIAAVAHAVVPGLPWSAAFVLGAAVAPPDPVAATSVAGRLGLPTRLVTILEGEGLTNDATAIVAYQLAITAAVTGSFTWGGAAAEIARSAPVGIVTGLVVGWGTAVIRRRVDDAMIETAASLLLPYVAYLLADHLGGSGVLSVVAFGFFIRRRATEIGTPATRLVNRTVWQAIDFVTGGLVFILVGIQLGRVLAAGISGRTVVHAALVTGTAIVVRLVWMYSVPPLVRLVTGERPGSSPSPAELTILGWAGMRGVVSLALALAIPLRTAAGQPFPARGELVALALAVVLVTLLGQGLTLAPLIRRLGLSDPEASERQARAARDEARSAGQERLEQLARQGAVPSQLEAQLSRRLNRDIGLGPPAAVPAPEAAPEADEARRMLLEALRTERGTVLRRRDAGELDEESATALEAELDLDELWLQGDIAKIVPR